MGHSLDILPHCMHTKATPSPGRIGRSNPASVSEGYNPQLGRWAENRGPKFRAQFLQPGGTAFEAVLH